MSDEMWARSGPAWAGTRKIGFKSPLEQNPNYVNGRVQNDDGGHGELYRSKKGRPSTNRTDPVTQMDSGYEDRYSKMHKSAMDPQRDHNVCGFSWLTMRYEKTAGPPQRPDDQSRWVIRWLYRESVPRHERASDQPVEDPGSLADAVERCANGGNVSNRDFIAAMEKELAKQKNWLDGQKDRRTNDELRFDFSLVSQTDIQITAAYLIRQKMEEDQAEVRAAKAGKWPNWLPDRERFNHKVTYVGPIPPTNHSTGDIQPHLACANFPPGTQTTNAIGKDAAHAALEKLESTGAIILEFRCVSSEFRVPTAGQLARTEAAMANIQNTEAFKNPVSILAGPQTSRNGGPSPYASTKQRREYPRQAYWSSENFQAYVMPVNDTEYVEAKARRTHPHQKYLDSKAHNRDRLMEMRHLDYITVDNAIRQGHNTPKYQRRYPGPAPRTAEQIQNDENPSFCSVCGSKSHTTQEFNAVAERAARFGINLHDKKENATHG